MLQSSHSLKIVPENQWLKDEVSWTGMTHFQGVMLVSGKVNSYQRNYLWILRILGFQINSSSFGKNIIPGNSASLPPISETSKSYLFPRNARWRYPLPFCSHSRDLPKLYPCKARQWCEPESSPISPALPPMNLEPVRMGYPHLAIGTKTPPRKTDIFGWLENRHVSSGKPPSHPLPNRTPRSASDNLRYLFKWFFSIFS